MKEMLGYQMDEVAASLISFDPTTLIEIIIAVCNAASDRQAEGCA